MDRSVLCKIKGSSLYDFKIGNEFEIKYTNEILNAITPRGAEFIGFEDPDIWIDNISHQVHLYFTIPFINATTEGFTRVSLGHAFGKSLDSLEMTMPVLQPSKDAPFGAKEVLIAPINKEGVRYNLFETGGATKGKKWHTVTCIAVAEDMNKPWHFKKLAFEPEALNISWIAAGASPAPLLPRNFLDVGAGKLLGTMNGISADGAMSGGLKKGIFRVGLFIYDYEHGNVDWVAEDFFIEDSEAKNITFASQFVDQGNGEGILYAHVDDSFVRAYTLNAEAIKALLP